jgi:hypothetical protein
MPSDVFKSGLGGAYAAALPIDDIRYGSALAQRVCRGIELPGQAGDASLQFALDVVGTGFG